jgi:adenine/guanine phosphoribosyltransferase-like PRPP-binding protein
MGQKNGAAGDKSFVIPRGKKPVTKASPAFAKELGYEPQYYGAQYLREFTNPEELEKRIQFAVRALKGHQFDAIAFSGMSGALIGPPVAMRLGKTFLMVRKGSLDESSHSPLSLEGDYAAKSYVILDDFSETGATVQRIKKEISAIMPAAKYVGFLAVKWITEARLAKAEKSKEPYPLPIVE